MNAPKPHIIRRGGKMQYPTEVIFYDNETKLIEQENREIHHELFLGYAKYVDYAGRYGDDDLFYDNADALWDFVLSKMRTNKSLTLIAHNQDFDFRVCQGFTKLAERYLFLHSMIPEYGRWILKYSTFPPKETEGETSSIVHPNTKRKYLNVLDTLNWLKASLAELGDLVGIPKLPFPGYEADMYTWQLYCMQDVIVLQKVFEEYVSFLQDNQLGTFAPTLAKQAFNAFKQRFLNTNIYVHHNPKATRVERESYFGGRTECFYIGKQPVRDYYKVDINSMYPYIMREKRFPVQLIKCSKIFRKDQWKHFYNREGIIAKVHVFTDTPIVPLKFKKKLIFPIGEFYTTLCYPELKLLDQEKIRYTVDEVCFYNTEKIFTQYVDALYEMRMRFKREGNKVYEKFCKLLLNSLYGKFGQRNLQWHNRGQMELIENWFREIYSVSTNEISYLKCIAGTVFESGEMTEGFETFVAIASYVTSWSREYLYHMICRAGRPNVYYVDTDSLIVNKQGYEMLKPFLHKTELGLLKLEGKSNHLHIHNLKDYEFGKEIKIKGVGSKGVKIDVNTFETEQWEHFNGAFRKDRVETVVTRKVIKTMKRVYNKGIVGDDGFVFPYRMGFDDEGDCMASVYDYLNKE